MDTWGSFPGGKRPGREADHSLPCSAEVKNEWSYTSTSLYVSMAWCLVKQRDNFTFVFISSISFLRLLLHLLLFLLFLIFHILSVLSSSFSSTSHFVISLLPCPSSLSSPPPPSSSSSSPPPPLLLLLLHHHNSSFSAYTPML